MEDGKAVCPWHAWAFDLETGSVDHDPGVKVAVYPVQAKGDEVLIGISD